MKRFAALILCMILAFTACIPAFAQQSGTCYYVDAVNGDDENDGTSQSSAWKTMARAAQTEFLPGDRLLLKRGQTFGGGFITKGSGSENAPVVISAYGEGASPVIYAQKGELLLYVGNVSHWLIEELEFTSDGYGVFIAAVGGCDVEDITVRNCYFHDISPDETDTNHAALVINSDRGKSKVKNIHLDSLRIENTAWGIHTNGTNAESDSDVFISPEKSYNGDYLFENLYIKNAKCGGIVLGAVYNGTVRNCRVLDCATAQDDAYAPLWLRHSDGITVEYCEIAGSTNKTDGMAIDFDGWTVNSTYRYIYSHDNVRFMKNCVFDSKTKNSGNTVCNCVSVNDNKKMNWGAVCLISMSKPSFGRMTDFTFRDNTVVNGKPFFWLCTRKPHVENIRFMSTPLGNFIQRLFNIFTFSKNFKYAQPGNDELENMIEEITSRLPE